MKVVKVCPTSEPQNKQDLLSRLDRPCPPSSSKDNQKRVLRHHNLCLWGNVFLFILSTLRLPALLSFADWCHQWFFSVMSSVCAVGFLMQIFLQTPKPCFPPRSLFLLLMLRCVNHCCCPGVRHSRRAQRKTSSWKFSGGICLAIISLSGHKTAATS